MSVFPLLYPACGLSSKNVCATMGNTKSSPALFHLHGLEKRGAVDALLTFCYNPVLQEASEANLPILLHKRCGFLTAQPDSELYVSELRQVQELLERLLLGCECRWNGKLVPVNYLLTWGQIQWDEARAFCAICVDRGVLSTEARWIVYFHEMLHTFSTGAEEPGVYFGLRGWEEGLVETLERLLRPELVQSLGLQFSAPVPEEIRQYESLNNYNRYVRALEAIGQEAGYDTGAWRTFLIELLSAPLLDRSYHTIISANAALQSFPAVERNRRLSKIAAACQELYGGTG